MHPGFDRPAWQQPAYPERASPPPQSQTGWFPLQQDSQQQQQSPVAHSQPQSGWLQDGANGVEYSAASSPTQAQRIVYASSPMYSSVPAPTPPYVWSGDAPTVARPSQFIPSQSYPRPLVMAPPETELYARAREQEQQKETVLRRNKQIAIGRWNSEEHQWFLKGLEMFQGPAWGEIARLIGTRTSTQVRTHAQKFFTKLARLNQTMPYFEVQIQKERARLVAQGANVTPTAQSGPSVASLSVTLSPRKRLASAGTSPRQSLKRFKDEVAATTSPTYAAAVQARYPQTTYDAKPPKVYTGMYSPAASPSGGPALSKEWTQQWTSEDGRQWPLASPTSTTASLQLTQLQMDDGGHQPAATSPSSSSAAAATSPDADSLPSMNKLLYRSAA
ncbi:LHY protein [Phytophthora cinnamomi]|uniref:LHY protein n=1 Tax=Phytophthora cinnamomi TaxID=4785 RepID=UPI00355A94B5|nr:LHY protein [Phytophthora cinnamomi]